MTSPQSQSIEQLAATKRGRRWLWIPITLLILIVVGAFLAWRHVTDPEFVRRAARDWLQRFANGRVEVGEASFSWSDGIELRDVAVMEVQSPDTHEESPVFECKRIHLSHHPWHMFAGQLKIDSILAEQPRCSIVRDAQDGTTNLAGLLAARRHQPLPAGIVMPAIELRDARIEVIYRDGQTERVVEHTRLSLRGWSSESKGRKFDLVWQSGTAQAATGRCRIDLLSGELRNIEGGLPWLAIEAVLIAANAKYEQAGMWADLLGIKGRVRASDYFIGLQPDERHYVTIQLKDAFLSVPITAEEQPLTPELRFLRFDHVDGSIAVRGPQLHAEFEGELHGAKCKVIGDLSVPDMTHFDSLADIALDVSVQADSLPLPQRGEDAPPAQARFVRSWTPLEKFYDVYEPWGAVDVDFQARKRAGKNEKLHIERLALTANGCSARHRSIPYRVFDMAGTIVFKPDGVFIQDIRGWRGETEIRVHGYLTDPSRCSAGELTITGRHLAFDDALFKALPPSFRTVCRRFAPLGTVDADIVMEREACRDGVPNEFAPDIALSLNGLDICYDEFPWQLEAATGTILINGRVVQIDNVIGAHGGAEAEVNGAIDREQGVMQDLSLHVNGRNVAIDEELMNALPSDIADAAGRFQPKGTFDIATWLGAVPQASGLESLSRIALNDVDIIPEAFPIPVRGVRGAFTLSDRRLELDRVTGRYGPMTLTATGSVDRTKSPARIDLSINGRNVVLDDRVRAAAPPALRESLEDWQVTGPFDLRADVVSATREDPGNVDVLSMARLRGATLNHPRLSQPLTDVHGDFGMDRTGIRSENARCRFGKAAIETSFDLAADLATGTFAMQVTDLALDDQLRGVLPASFQTIWDERGPEGKVDLHFKTLKFSRLPESGQRVWSVEGAADLEAVSLVRPMALADMHGSISFEGMLLDRLGGTALNGALDISTMNLSNRPAHEIKADWSLARTADDRGGLQLKIHQAGICGGTTTGTLTTEFDRKQTRYQLSAMAYQLDIAKISNRNRSDVDPAGGGTREAQTEENPFRGRADIDLVLNGTLGDPFSTQGRGRIEVNKADFYQLPLVLAVMNVTDFARPDDAPRTDAHADFFVLGRTVEFTDLLLQGSTMRLVGRGNMTLPDWSLDLDLITASPRAWDRFPGLTEVVEGVSREFVALHVTGPIDRPVVRPRPFGDLQDELKRLFVKKARKKIHPETAER